MHFYRFATTYKCCSVTSSSPDYVNVTDNNDNEETSVLGRMPQDDSSNPAADDAWCGISAPNNDYCEDISVEHVIGDNDQYSFVDDGDMEALG